MKQESLASEHKPKQLLFMPVLGQKNDENSPQKQPKAQSPSQ